MVRQYPSQQVSSFMHSRSSHVELSTFLSRDRCALPSSFFIHFFLGPPPASPETWSFAPNLIASHSVLVPSPPTSPTESLSYGQVPLTFTLLNSPLIPELTPDCVIPVLKDQLQWRIQSFDDKPVDIEAIPSLKLYVAGQKVRQNDGWQEDRFPKYDPLVAYREVTSGKAGGLRDEDQL